MFLLLTEEKVLNHNGLLRELAQVALAGAAAGQALVLDASPGQVDVKQQQQGAESNNRRLQNSPLC